MVCLQELKAADAEFPKAAIERAGYGAVWRGQKILERRRHPRARRMMPIVTRTELPGDPADTQSRYIEAAVNGVLVASLYAPNGNPQPGPKFNYKLAWLERLAAHAAELYAAGVPVVLAGDFNVVPTDRDIYPTKSWARTRCCSRKAAPPSAASVDQGWIDAIRTLHPDAPMYTLLGLHAEPLAARRRLAHRSSAAERTAPPSAWSMPASIARVRGKDGASDHAPAWVVLRDAFAASRSNSARRTATGKANAGRRADGASREARRLQRRPLLVIDGNSFAHRSYHAPAEDHSAARRQRRRRHRRLRQCPAAPLPGRAAARRARRLGHA